MQKRKIMKIIKLALIFTIIVSIINTSTITVNAHNLDNWSGNVPYSVTGLRLGINASALNSVLTLTVYNSANSSSVGGWSSTISPHAYVSSIVNVSANPAAVRDINVVGVALVGAYGQIVPRDSFGNICAPNSFWSSVEIQINNNASVWGDSTVSDTVKTQRARMTYFHEIGHAFKLSHPAVGTTATAITGHNVFATTSVGTGWHAVALMNTGFPGVVVAAGVSAHDISNIFARWR